MYLEGIMLGEGSQMKKGRYCMTSLIFGIQKPKAKPNSQKKRSHLWVPEVGRGIWRKVVKRYKLPIVR